MYGGNEYMENYSTWRCDSVTLTQGDITDFAFFDTKPNMFYIKNPNDVQLYIGLKKMPTQKRYDFSIDANSHDAFGQPNGTGHLYILNPSNKNIVIEVYSIYEQFDISLLKNYNVNLDDISFGSEVTFPEGYVVSVDVNSVLNKITESNNILKTIESLNNEISSKLNTSINSINRITAGTSTEYDNIPKLLNKMNDLSDLLNILIDTGTDENYFNISSIILGISQLKTQNETIISLLTEIKDK